MRCFLGLELDLPALKESYRDIVLYLKRSGVKGNIVPLENMHLTYIFFGNLSLDEVKDIIDIIDRMENVKKYPSHVKINRISSFNGRVIFFDVQDQDEIKMYRERIYKNIQEKIGICENNEFHAHITIMRVKERCNMSVIDDVNCCFHPFVVDVKSLCLFESIFMGRGVVYKKIKCWR